MIRVCLVFEFTLAQIKLGFKKVVGNTRDIDVKGSSNQLCRP